MSLLVLVDANAIVERDWHLASAPWRVLLYRARTGQQRVVVLESTVLEVVARYEAVVTKTLTEASDLARRFVRLGIDSIPVDVGDSINYESQLRERLLKSSVEVPMPTIGVLPLVRRAVYRRRPFDQKGTGFRDALLWEETISLAATAGYEGCALVSNDKRAFYSEDGRGLHPDLAADLTERGFAVETVRLYESLPDLLRSTQSEDPGLLAQVIHLVETELDQIARSISDAVWSAELSSGGLGADIEIEYVYEPESVVVDHVVASAEQAGPVLVELSAECRVGLSVDLVSAGRPEWTAYSVEIDIPIEATATFDPLRKELDDFAVSEIEVDAEDLLESSGRRRWIYDPSQGRLWE